LKVVSSEEYQFVAKCGGGKVGNLFLYGCSIFQNNSYNNILENIVDCNMLTFAQTSKQVNTQIGMSTFTT
jgi:hypothetical protein